MVSQLDLLFNPRSVALVGASGRPGKIGNTILINLMDGNFRLYLVNPNEAEINGIKTYKSIMELPEVVDLAVLAISAKITPSIVEECVRKGVPFVISVAAGFGEIGEEGKALERKISEILKGSNTRLVGPNTLGIIVTGNKLDTLFVPRERSPRPVDGEITLISQSGSIMCGLYEMAEDMGVGIRACVGLGNKVDLSENDYLEYFAQDDRTKSIAMYLESFSDGREFIRLCRQITPHKPIVAIKVGSTEKGAKAAMSHTGAMASSSDALVTGVFKQIGVQRAYDEVELIDMAKALAYLDHIKGDRVAIVSSTGGFGVIATDIIESKDKGVGMKLAEISERAKRLLKEKTQYYASVENPIDLTGSVTDDMYGDVLEIIQSEDGVDAVLVLLQLQPPLITNGLVDIAEEKIRKGGKPTIVCCIGGSIPRPMLRRFEQKKIPAYNSLSRAIKALRCLYERGLYLKRIGMIQ